MEKKRNIVLTVMDAVSACVAPVIPVLLGCGLIKLLVMLIGFTGLSGKLGDFDMLLGYIDTAPFYFLPFLLAWSSAAYFQCNPAFAMAAVSVMFFPEFISVIESGASLHLMGIPVLTSSYGYTVVPVILLVFLMKYIQHGFEKCIKGVVGGVFVPMLTILLTGIAGIMLVGPVTTQASKWISDGIGWLQINYPVFAWAFLCAVLPLMIMTGTHFIFTAIALEQLGELNMEMGFHVSCFIVTMCLTAACLAVGAKSRGEQREKAFSAGITAFMTGTSEPALFGICLALKTPLFAVMAGGAAAGIWQGIHALHSYIFASSSIFSVLMFYSSEEPGNFVNTLIAGGIGFTATAILTAVLYRFQPVQKSSDRNSVDNQGISQFK